MFVRPSSRLASLPDAACAGRLSFTPHLPARGDLRPVVRACLLAHRSALKNFSGRFPRTRRHLFRHPLDSCTQIAAGIFPVFKAARALRPDTMRRGKCHELSYWTWMKYPIPSPGEGGAFSATPPTTSRHHVTGQPPTPQPCRRPGPAAATETAIALCPPPPALTDKQPPTCRNCPAKYTEQTQREPESVVNGRFCFNSPLKTIQTRPPLRSLLPAPPPSDHPPPCPPPLPASPPLRVSPLPASPPCLAALPLLAHRARPGASRRENTRDNARENRRKQEITRENKRKRKNPPANPLMRFARRRLPPPPTSSPLKHRKDIQL